MRSKLARHLSPSTALALVLGLTLGHAAPARAGDQPTAATADPNAAAVAPAPGKHVERSARPDALPTTANAAPPGASGAPTPGPNPNANPTAQANAEARAAEPGSTPDQPSLLDKESAVKAYRKALAALKRAEDAALAAGEDSKAGAEAAVDDAKKKGAAAVQLTKEQIETARREALAALEDARGRLHAAGRQLQKIELTPKLRAAMDELLKPAGEKRKATRAERSEASREALRKEHGKALDSNRAQAQLARHAWRVARLNRLIELSEAAGQAEPAGRARALLAQEEAENRRLLKELEGGDALAKKSDEAKDKPAAALVAPATAKPTAPKAAAPKSEVKP